MLRAAEEALHLASGRNRADLDSDRLLNLALTRLLEVVGEAASRVTEVTRVQHPNVPWSQIVAMRNRLIHGYDNVDFDILRDIVQIDLGPLVAHVRAKLAKSTDRDPAL
jgi:uncharacterized protein with HEPN domain